MHAVTHTHSLYKATAIQEPTKPNMTGVARTAPALLADQKHSLQEYALVGY